jgi:ubiquitin-activating enzyme E1 C
LEEFPRSFFKSFDICIAGLDNVAARSWLNQMLISLVEYDEEGNMDPSTVVPMIDGGTTGFAGQARIIIPRVTACFTCTLVTLPKDDGAHLCTIATVPRTPQHCIAYASIILWKRLLRFDGVNDYQLADGGDAPIDTENAPPEGKVSLDTDSAEHMTWLMNRAIERANQFGIEGVTFAMTQQVVKNIIPAIASTNAAISAACVNEALKWVARSHPRVDSYFQYAGGAGLACEVHNIQRLADCSACKPLTFWNIQETFTVQDALDRLKAEFNMDNPVVTYGALTIFLKGVVEDNRTKTFASIGVPDKGTIVAQTDIIESIYIIYVE